MTQYNSEGNYLYGAANAANFVTISRVALTPFFLICLAHKQFFPALLFFAASAATDFADGLVARTGKQKTALGAFLDPLADKTLLIPTYSLLAWTGAIPKWLFVLLICRDFTIFTGWLAYAIHDKSFKTHSRLLGKITIAGQMILFLAILSFLALPWLQEIPIGRFIGMGHTVVAALTFASFMDYVIFGSKHLGEDC